MRHSLTLTLALLALGGAAGAAHAGEPPLEARDVPRTLRAIRAHLPTLREEEPAAARVVAAQLDLLAGRLAGTKPFPRRQRPTALLYTCYEAEGVGDRVKVQVKDTSGPLVLILSGCESVWWSVEVGRGVDLRKVIVTGAERQTLENPQAFGEAEVLLLGPGQGGRHLTFEREDDPDDPARSRARLRELVGDLPLVVLERYDSAPLVELGPASAEWRQAALTTDLDELRSLAFRGLRARVRQELAQHRFQAVYRGRLCEFAGLKVTAQGPRLRGHHVALTAQGSFALDSHELYRLDEKGQASRVEFRKEPGVPRLSWPMGLAEDAPRDRLLIPWLGGRGGIFAYYPQQDRWELTWQPPERGRHVDLGPMALSGDGSVAYSLAWDHGGRGGSTLYAFDAASCAVSRTIELSRALPTDSRTGGQLVPLGERLGWLVGEECWVLEPSSGRVLGRFGVHPLADAAPAQAPRPR